MPETSRKNAPVPVPVARIDFPRAVRGASTGFSILLIGGFLAPMLTLVSTLAAGAWLAGVAVVAFAIAARRSQRAGIPALHGIFAALLAYALVLPLLLPFEQGRDVRQIAQTMLTAVMVGAITGAVAARRVVPSGQSGVGTLVRRTGPARRVST